MILELWQFYMTATALQSLIKLGYQHRDEFECIYVALCSAIIKRRQRRQSKIDEAFRAFEDDWQIQ